MSYDELTGVFVWLSGHKRGKVAGSKHNAGYISICINRRIYLAHRLAWLYVTGTWPVNDIDHVDGVRDNNIFSNLRDVTKSQNMKNSSLSSSSTSGVTGVSLRSDTLKWRAHIKTNGKQTSLGTFNVFWDAVCARKSAEVCLDFHPNHGKELRYGKNN